VDARDPANTYESLESDDVSARVGQGVAVVTLLVRAKSVRGGKALSGAFRNVRMFVRESDKQPAW
jgi:hypothetical protein